MAKLCLVHIVKNVISLEVKSDAYDFLRCIVDWVTLRFLSVMDVDEFRWIAIDSKRCAKKVFFLEEQVG